MQEQKVPTNMLLLQGISELLPLTASIFKKTASSCQVWDKLMIQQSENFLEDEIFTSDTNLVAFSQLIQLISLILFHGMNSPMVKGFQLKDMRVNLTWEGGIVDTFKVGNYGSDYLSFIKVFNQKILNETYKNQSVFGYQTVKQIYTMLMYYLDVLLESKKMLELVVKSNDGIRTVLDKDVNETLLFIIISAMPVDQINAFFLQLVSYFPPDLEVKSPNGHPVSLASLFESPTTDYNYLVQKIKIYLGLYYTMNMPIIRSITRAKSKELLSNMMQNTAVKKEIKKHITSACDNQVLLRYDLIKVFSDRLSQNFVFRKA